MAFQKELSKLLYMIEQQKYDKLSLNELSNYIYFSGSHFQRMFKLLTGQSVMDYARGRKLAHSLGPLYESDLRVIDIANEYGFAHEQSYTRAFRKEYGCSPGEARKNRLVLPIRERIVPEALQTVQNGVLAGPDIVMTPGLHVIGRPHYFENYRIEINGLEPNKLGNDFYKNDLPRLKNLMFDDVYYAVVTAHSWQPYNMEYMPSCQVKDFSEIPEGLQGRVIPAGLSVRFIYVAECECEEIGPEVMSVIYKALDQFFHGQTRYVVSNNMHYERIARENYDGRFCKFECVYFVKDTLENPQES